MMLIAFLALSPLSLLAQNNNNEKADSFKVIARKSISNTHSNQLGHSTDKGMKTFKIENENGGFRYKILDNTTSISIEALSNIAYSRKANRIVTYGDSLDNHIITKAYVRFYSADGQLIKNLGLVAQWPFVSTLSESGNFLIAGNKSLESHSPLMALMLFDHNGNKKWEKAIPKKVPTNIFSDQDGSSYALVLHGPEDKSSSILFYDNNGTLIFTNDNHIAISGVEFLPSNKVVVTTGNAWYLYSISSSKPLASGALNGTTIGKLPITIHPSKNIFFIVSVSNLLKNNGFRIQAFNSLNGTLIAESTFEGKPTWKGFRLVEVLSDGTIQFLTSNEAITLRLVD